MLVSFDYVNPLNSRGVLIQVIEDNVADGSVVILLVFRTTRAREAL